MKYNFHSIGVNTHGRTSGKVKTFCPKCHESRRNKRDKSMSVNIDDGKGKCHHCGYTFHLENQDTMNQKRKAGFSKGRTQPFPPAHFRRPVPGPNRSALSDRLLKWFEEERCIPQSALIALRITEQEEWMPQTGQKANCICFNYYEADELINVKYRDGAKNFKMVSGAELIPYNIDSILGTPEAIITEGEMDALSFIAIGRTDVVSVPAGANANLTWLDRFVETHFEDKKCIYLATDNDPKGVLLRDELLRRLGSERCRLVHFGFECKDANEHLQKHGATSLRIALEQAEELPIDGVFSVDDLEDELRLLYENGLESGAETGWENFDPLCTFELQRLAIVTGMPGHGKSEFVDELVLRLCLRHDWRASFFSAENIPITYHYRKIIEKLTGLAFSSTAPGMTESLYRRARKFLSQNISHILPEEAHTLDVILSKARALVSRKGIRIFIIDPFNRIMHQIPAGMTETQYISLVLNQLSVFAVRNRCLVILVAHPRKMNRNPLTNKKPMVEMYDINGSAEFYNKADFGIIVHRDDEAGVVRVNVEKVKFKHLGKPGEASYVYDTMNGRYYTCEESNDASLSPEKRIRQTNFETQCWLPEEEEEQGAGLF